MLQHNNPHKNSIAPSPVVPPDIPLSRRGKPSMSALPGGNIQPPALSDIQTRSEHVPDLVQFFQAQDSLSTGSSQSTGAREMFKAGQRRLRQLTQRPKKGTDPQAKAEEVSRQLLALQQEGFLPASLTASKPKRSAPKRSIDSAVSSARSASNLSFRSSSRRDVESIGQPWLEGTLERLNTRETEGIRLSSLDLRDLTSLIEASLSESQFEDVTPPPYQSSTLSNNLSRDGRSLQEHSSGSANKQNPTSMTSGQSDEIEALPEFPGIPERTSSNHSKILISAPSSDNKQQSSSEQLNAAKTAEPKDAADVAGDRSSTSNTSSITQTHPNPVALSLKLFPDTTAPRMSSKGAWRISNGCPPPSIRSLPNTIAQQSSSAVSTQPTDGNMKHSFSNPKCHDESEKLGRSHQTPSTQLANVSRSTATSPIHEKFPLARNSRRPSSLPMRAIDAFPMPAPMRPLPVLPEPVPGFRPNHGQNAPGGRRVLSANQTQQELEAQSRSTEEVSKESSVRCSNQTSMASQTAPDNRKDLATERGNEPPRTDAASPTELIQSVKAGQSRAERVRALKKKDMTASRIQLRDSESPSTGGGLLSQSSRLSQTASAEASDGVVEKRYGRTFADTHSPPLSPLPSKPSRQATDNNSTSRQDGSSLSCTNGMSLVNHELSSLPTSKRNSQIYQNNSSRSTSVLGEMVTDDFEPHERLETALASSEDEGVDVNLHKQQTRPTPSKRRRHRPTPIVVDDSGLRKSYHIKKSSAYDYSHPMTPRNHKSHGLERVSPHSPLVQSNHYYPETRGGRHRSSYVMELEKRIAHLEHQNKTLQAALLAALGVGAKHNVDGLNNGSSISPLTPPTSRSFSSGTNTSSSSDYHDTKERGARRRQPPYRPESWIASPGSSRRSSYGSEESAAIRELEDMIEDSDFGWESDQPSCRRTQQLKMRA